MKFREFIHEALLALMVGVAGYGASQLNSATTSINELNKNMGVVVEKLTYQSESLKDHENRIRILENHGH